MKSKCFFLYLIIVFNFIPCFFFAEEEAVVQQRKDVIKYGLEPEVSELLTSLSKEKNGSYDSELAELFSTTKSTSVRDAILSLFAAEKNQALKDYALTVLEDPYETKSSTVQAVFSYVAELQIKESLPAIRKILQSENTQYRDKAISVLGKIGEPQDASLLIEYLDGELSGDDKQRLIIRQNVMTAIGELKAVETWNRLIEIAKDTDENATIRATAAIAIGKMGKEDAIPVLETLFEDTDPILRTASISSLSNFNTKESQTLILQGFKDSYYKVRLESISAVEKQKNPDALPYLLYRAKNDPVEDIRFRSYEVIALYNMEEGNSWLKGVFTDEKDQDKDRAKAMSVLAKNNFDYVFPEIEKVAVGVLKDDKKTWLRYEIGKTLASIKDSRSASIAEKYLTHKDTLTRSVGLDMFEKNKYQELHATIEAIAADEKQGALQRRAKKILAE